MNSEFGNKIELCPKVIDGLVVIILTYDESKAESRASLLSRFN